MLYSAYKDTVTYWGPGVPNGYGGRTFPSPIQLHARWEDRNDQVMTPQGDQIISRSVVFVQQDVGIQGYMYNGISAAADPTTLDDAFEIRAFIKVPDLRRNNYERRAIL